LLPQPQLLLKAVPALALVAVVAAPSPMAPPVSIVLMASVARTFLNVGIEFPPWKDGLPFARHSPENAFDALNGSSPQCLDFLASVRINGDRVLLLHAYAFIGCIRILSVNL
jgi:hypothetical protein